MTGPVLEVRFGAATHQGLVRATNEDSYLASPPVFVVADGMGGHAAGEIASKTVVDVFATLSTQEWLTSDELIAAVDRSVAGIADLSGGVGRAPGSTLSGVGLTHQAGQPCWLVFNVGDSRTHLLRGGELSQISIDHAAATEAAVAGQPRIPRGVITRALGAGLATPVVDQWLIPAMVGDTVLICSDGLTNEVTSALLTASLLTTQDPQEAAGALVRAALLAGGHDNVTVVVVRCTDVVPIADHDVLWVDSTISPATDDTVPDSAEGR